MGEFSEVQEPQRVQAKMRKIFAVLLVRNSGSFAKSVMIAHSYPLHCAPSQNTI